MEDPVQFWQKKYSDLVNSIDDIVWEKEAKTFQFLFISNQAEKILGYPVELWLKEPFFWQKHLHPDDQEWVIDFCKSATAEKRNYELSYRMIGSEGQIVWFRETVVVVLENDEPIFLRGAMIDITKRMQMEEELARLVGELKRSNSELEQFAYVASHDLQEPLRMITSYLQLLSTHYQRKLNKDADDYIAYALEGAQRMQKIVIDLLEYSRVTSRGKDFVLTDSNLVLEQALKNLEVAIKESGAEITHDHLPLIFADASQIAQLFQNLIGNALKFRSQKIPHIHISAQPKEKEWMFSVEDNGIGFDPKDAERIFIMFHRLHSQAEYPGTGIGLAICKKIVERHGGQIWAKSEPGKGSVFYFTVAQRGGEKVVTDAT